MMILSVTYRLKFRLPLVDKVEDLGHFQDVECVEARSSVGQ